MAALTTPHVVLSKKEREFTKHAILSISPAADSVLVPPTISSSGCNF